MQYTWTDIEQHIAVCHPLAILRDPPKYEEAKRDFCEIVRKRNELCR